MTALSCRRVSALYRCFLAIALITIASAAEAQVEMSRVKRSELGRLGFNPQFGPLPPETRPTARITNFSVRATLVGGQALTAGLTIEGAGSVLVRGAGPALTAFGVQNPMPSPVVDLIQSGSKIVGIQGWDALDASLRFVAGRVGAFPFAIGSRDVALVRVLTGMNTFVVRGDVGGTVLLEAYDVDGVVSARMTNISARCRAQSADDQFIVGFIISSSGAQRYLIRGVGPGLKQFGIAESVTGLRLTLYGQGGRIADTSEGWTADFAALFRSAGAFPLPPGSRDVALDVHLGEGVYTLVVTSSSAGDVLCEMYELPPVTS